jgi:hypothetical protein
MDNIKETSESFTKINLNKEKSQTRSPQNEEDYFRGSTSNENDSEFQIKLKTKIPFHSKNKFTKNDFEILGLLGRGAYARVVKARLIKNDTIYAIKIIEKEFIEKVNLVFTRGK